MCVVTRITVIGVLLLFVELSELWPKLYSLLKGVCIYKNVVPEVK